MESSRSRSCAPSGFSSRSSSRSVSPPATADPSLSPSFPAAVENPKARKTKRKIVEKGKGKRNPLSDLEESANPKPGNKRNKRARI